MQKLFADVETPTIDKPKPPRSTKEKAKPSITARPGQRQSSDPATSTNNEGSGESINAVIYAEEVKNNAKEKKTLETTIVSIFNIVWGQCSQLMKHQIMSLEEYDKKEKDGDVAWLLKEIRQINEMDTNVSIYYTQHKAIKKFYEYYQGEEEDIATQLKMFKVMIAVVGHCG